MKDLRVLDELFFDCEQISLIQKSWIPSILK